MYRSGAGTHASLQTEWEFVVANIIESASSLFLNGICILLAMQASYFLKRRGSAGRGVLICAMMLAYGLYLPGHDKSALTGLTAGRIWWTRRHLQVIGEPKLEHRYKTAIKMLFESSLLYFEPHYVRVPRFALFVGASLQLMNIMPALVIVRVSLARSVDADPTAGNLKLESSVY
ncbi:hypothetical protein B0H13DRAFT_2378142 [Mycena leptocephala]|nr:hypothetical protein B0H13DRAFT_2378142 [Mycena leptocephala]